MHSSERPSEPAAVIVGWREPVALPQWGINHIKTKIDTGARTSAIHVDNICELGKQRVRFDVIVSPACDGAPAKMVNVETAVVRVSRVRPSTGARQQRLVVRTRIRIGRMEREIELSLVSRHGMLCRLLLGRSALNGFLVDPSHPRRLVKRRGNERKRS